MYADGVSILNLSAHNFPVDAFHWNGADRFRASYLTIWNVGQYGIYAEDGEQGTVDHDYVSGAADAAYYIGECKHCRATLSHVVATLSAVGYSGTNASEVTIRDSVWDRNGAGIVPNTYANEAHPPQARATIIRNSKGIASPEASVTGSPSFRRRTGSCSTRVLSVTPDRRGGRVATASRTTSSPGAAGPISLSPAGSAPATASSKTRSQRPCLATWVCLAVALRRRPATRGSPRS